MQQCGKCGERERERERGLTGGGLLDEERSDKKGKGKKQERQREVEEKEIRAAARAAYFAAQ